MLDSNHNGIPDYQEPFFWRAVGGAVAFFVKLLAPTHTVAYRAADAFQRTVDQLEQQRTQSAQLPPGETK